MGDDSPVAEAEYFDGFFTPTFYYSGTGMNYVNRELVMQVPYTPSRTIFSSFLLQANDPLIHYLASDLNAHTNAIAVWQNGTQGNGFWYQSDDLTEGPLPVPPISPIKGRYQPWGGSGQMAASLLVDSGVYNLSLRDPLVWGADYWNFPTNLMSSLSGLGQVHRGTPWQTFYLKSPNVLQEAKPPFYGLGVFTWMAWTGDSDLYDASLMAPVYDWQLAGLVMSLLNTNDPTQLLSVKDQNLGDWQNALNGLMVYSNSMQYPHPSGSPQFDPWVMASNSAQASIIADAIVQTNTTPGGPFFSSIGVLLMVPALTVQSPYLNLVNASSTLPKTNYGISDFAYEAIPAQLLPLLRPDSIGSLTPTNGVWNVSFSGADGYNYVVQTSTNLADWATLATNQPVQGVITVSNYPPAGSSTQFFRTRLLP